MKGFVVSLLFVAFSAVVLWAQQPPWEIGLMFVPGANTIVQSKTVHVQKMVLVNQTASTVTVTLSDNSTNCSGGPCTVYSAPIAATTTYTVDLGGVRATNGLFWSASTANAVSAWVKGTYGI